MELDRALIEHVVGDAEADLYCIQRADVVWVAALRPDSWPITSAFIIVCFFSVLFHFPIVTVQHISLFIFTLNH